MISRKRERYADDIVVGFQYCNDAEQFQQELTERMRRFKLELHPEKTRFTEFGRFAADNRKERGKDRSETFNFLGFTHVCGKTRKGKFTVLRHTMQKKMQRKLQEIKVALRKRMHWTILLPGLRDKKMLSREELGQLYDLRRAALRKT